MAHGVVAVLWLVVSPLIKGFGAYAHLRYIVELAVVIGLVGVGQTIAVIGGGIYLSVSAVITVTAIGRRLSRPLAAYHDARNGDDPARAAGADR